MPHSNREDTPTVLIVEDDKELADTYGVWLESEYDVRLTYSGSGALTWYDPEVDVVLLDRKMPDFSGLRVARIMEQRDVDDQRAMLTSSEPGSDLTEMPCDEYLTKPVTKAQLRDTVRELQLRLQLDQELQRHFALTSKLAALENSDVDEAEETIADLRREVERSRARVEDRLLEFDDAESAYKSLD